MKYSLVYLFLLVSFLSQGQVVYKIDSTYSLQVLPTETLYDGTKIQHVKYDSIQHILYVEDACNVTLKLFPPEPSKISYKIVDSINPSNVSYSSIYYGSPTSSILRVPYETNLVSHNGVNLFKISRTHVRTVFPKFVDLNMNVVEDTIPTDFLKSHPFRVLVTTSSDNVPFSCGHNYYGSFVLTRNGKATILYNDTLTPSFNLQEGDKLVGAIATKDCSLLNGGYGCLNYLEYTDTLYVQGLVTSSQEKKELLQFISGPNPVSDYLFFKATVEFVRVYDVMGQIVCEHRNAFDINLHGVPMGNYLVETEQEGKIFRKWIVKK